MKIVVIIKKEIIKNRVYSFKEIFEFKRKSIRYYLCIIFYKLRRFDVDIIDFRKD